MSFGQRFTVKSFAELLGCTEEAVRQKCRGQIDKRWKTGKAAELPSTYRAIKCECQRDWIIEDVSSGTGNVLEIDREQHAQTESWSNAFADWWHKIASLQSKAAGTSSDAIVLTSWEELKRKPDRWRPDKKTTVGEARSARKAKPAPPIRVVPLFANPLSLFQLIGKCYRLSVLSDNTIEIKVTFKPDGGWQYDYVGPKDQPLLYDEIACGRRHLNLIRSWARSVGTEGGVVTPWKYLIKDRKCAACYEHIDSYPRRQFCSECFGKKAAFYKFLKRLATQKGRAQRVAVYERLKEIHSRP